MVAMAATATSGEQRVASKQPTKKIRKTESPSETSKTSKNHKQAFWELVGMLAAFLCNLQNWTYQHSFCITTVCRSISEFSGTCEIASSSYIIFPDTKINVAISESAAITNLKLPATCFKNQDPAKASSQTLQKLLACSKPFERPIVIQVVHEDI